MTCQANYSKKGVKVKRLPLSGASLAGTAQDGRFMALPSAFQRRPGVGELRVNIRDNIEGAEGNGRG